MGPVFKPYKALGYVTEPVQFAVRKTGSETHVVVSVGKAWQTYNCDRLRLLQHGPEFNHKIRALACRSKWTFAGVGSDIEVCHRLTRMGRMKGQGGKIIQLLCMGDLVISLAQRQLVVWKHGDYETPQQVIKLESGFTPTCMVHPETYVNKIVVGSREGGLQLWNIYTGKLIHSFKGWGSSVHCIESSPALDVVGVGLGDGRAILHNLKFDEEVFALKNASGSGMHLFGGAANQSSGGACTALSFSTGAGAPLLAAGGHAGVITVWNLEEKRLSTVLNAAHDGPLVSLYFFPKSPVLMSSAADNSIKHWIFDNADGSSRLLRFASGHRAPPNCIKFYKEGLRILSAGQDRAFWMFSMLHQQRGLELSQGHTGHKAKRVKISESKVKLGRVTQMDACEVRERDWANAITAHDGDHCAYTWKLRDYTIGKHVLRLPSGRVKGYPGNVTSVCLSHCGNFGFVGSSLGRMDKYNMQSGIHRGDYCRVFKIKGQHPAHDGQVTGVACDASNKKLVTGGYDGHLRIWDFKSRRLMCQVPLSSPVGHLTIHPSTSLCAVCCDDWGIRVVDVEVGRIVRRFVGHEDRVTCLTMASDGKWLISSSMDGTIRIWDVPSSQIFQVMLVDDPVTSLSISPSMEFLATSHAGRQGIYLWTNQLLFGASADVLPSDKPVPMSLPAIMSEWDGYDENTSGNAPEKAEDVGEEMDSQSNLQQSMTPLPLVPGLVTLSMLPRTQWHNLANIELIKERNKPIKPAEKPEAAPFFLPTVAGLSKDVVFDVESGDVDAEMEDKAQQNEGTASRVLRGLEASETPFLTKLKEFDVSGDPKPLMLFLRTLSAARIDEEVHRMDYLPTPFAEGETRDDLGEIPQEVQDIQSLLEFIECQLDAKTDFEFIQALLQLVLNVHDTTITKWVVLAKVCTRIHDKLQAMWNHFGGMIQDVHCMINYFTSWQG